VVGNAVKFTSIGQVTLEITSKLLASNSSNSGDNNVPVLSATDRAAGYSMYEFHFTVTDSGAGIPLSFQPLLFRLKLFVDPTSTVPYIAANKN
jgi:signal transduction histidine kinase